MACPHWPNLTYLFLQSGQRWFDNYTPTVFLGNLDQLWRNISLSVCCLVSQPTTWKRVRLMDRWNTVASLALVLQLRNKGGFLLVRPMMAQHMFADRNWVIFTIIRVNLIRQKLYSYVFLSKTLWFYFSIPGYFMWFWLLKTR